MSPVIVIVIAGLAIAIVMSIACFAAYAVDKAAARSSRRRIRERTLLTLGFLGGWPGALVAQRVLRHKTLKQPFRTRFALTVVGNLVLVVLAIVVTAIVGPDHILDPATAALTGAFSLT